MSDSTKKEIVFLHPDLGIGGAERAVIDAAIALKTSGHAVQFLTCHHDPNHCFIETRDGTLKVTVAGDWLPRKIFGRCYAFCAYLRMIYAAFYLIFFSGITFDLIFCDQIAACIPILRLVKCKILFYCHFPDLLLSKRTTFVKKLYRAPIDWLEEKSTGMADIILVNSQFTKQIFRDTFKTLNHVYLEVLYPIPNFKALNQTAPERTADLMPADAQIVYLSINRYERKKNIALAVEALAILQKKLGSLENIHLIIAGGYDDRVVENIEYYSELKRLVCECNVENNVSFLRSISDDQKRTLLVNSSCLLYTPDKEHFGIVPVEAMYLKCPVIAVSSGGPLETVNSGVTGFLCEPTPEAFSSAMKQFVDKLSLKVKMGESSEKWIKEKFSYEAFAKQLNDVIKLI